MIILKREITLVSFLMLLFLFPALALANNCELGEVSLVNNSFELPRVNSSEKWDIFPNQTSGLGWSVEWRDNDNVVKRPEKATIELQQNTAFRMAYDGLQYTELDSDWNGPSSEENYKGEPSSTNIYQDIATIPGAEYELEFSFSAHPSTSWEDNILQISWDGDLVDVVSASGTGMTLWHTYKYNLVATKDISRLMFGDLGEADSYGTFLDDVKLTLIHCPSEDSGSGSINNGGSAGSSIFPINTQEDDEVWVLGFSSDEFGDLSICDQEAFNISSIVTKPKNSARDEALFAKVYKDDSGIYDTRTARLAYFISSNGPCTRHLGAGERAGVVDSFQSAFGRLPVNFDDWSEVIKMANGRWTKLRNDDIEARARKLFESVYLRKIDTENKYDMNALMTIAYGLRPQPRDLLKEKRAIDIFIDIFHYQPQNSLDWSTMRAIAYSGAKR